MFGIDWLVLALSLGYEIPSDERTESEYFYQFNVGDPLYVWANYTDADIQQIGQTLGGINMYGLGLGYRWQLTEKTSALIEYGYYKPDPDPAPNVEWEIVEYTLRRDFGQPLFTARNHVYELDSSNGIVVGVDHAFNDWLSVGVAYRALSFNEKFEMWVGERHDPSKPETDCVCWWVMNENRSMNSVQARITYTFR